MASYIHYIIILEPYRVIHYILTLPFISLIRNRKKKFRIQVVEFYLYFIKTLSTKKFHV